jgi:hypothetical protein
MNRWAGHIACIGEMINTYITVAGKLNKRPKHYSEDDTEKKIRIWFRSWSSGCNAVLSSP